MRYIVLKSEQGSHVGKVFKSLGDQGEVNIPPRWIAYPETINTIEDFSQLAIDLQENHPDSALIFGELTEQGIQKASNREVIYRRDTYIKDRDQNLILLDVEYEDLLDHLDDEARIEAHIQRLPSYFHKVSYHYQLSSGHQVKDKKLRVHLFMMVDQAINTTKLKKYLNELKHLVDPNPIHYSTPIFMSRPRFEGLPKDLIENRSGFIKKERASVILPRKAYKAIEEKIESVSTINYQGFISEDIGAKSELERVVNEARNLMDDRNRKIFIHAKRIGRFVGAHRLSYDEAFSAIYEAYIVNGFLDKRKAKLGAVKGESDMRKSIKNGLEKGALNPLLSEVFEPDTSSSRTFKKKAPKERLSRQAVTSPANIRETTRRLIEDAIYRAREQAIEAIQIMTGAGKSRALLQIAGERYHRGESIIYLVGNHALIEGEGGSIQRLKELHPNIKPDVWKGRNLQCSVLSSVKERLSSDDEQIRREAEEENSEHLDLLEGGVSIPAFCKYISCPKYETSACSAWQEPERPIENRFIIAPHSYLSYLARREERDELPENVLVIIDELPELSPSTYYEADLIKPFMMESYEARQDQELDDEQTKFKRMNNAITQFANTLQPLLDKTFKKITVNQYGGDLLLKEDDLLSEHSKQAINLLKQKAYAMLDHLEENIVNPPKLSKLKAQEANLSGRRIRRRGIKLITYLARLITNQLEAGEKLHLVVTSLEEGAVRLIERGAPLPLPNTSRIVVADATPRAEYFNGYAKSLGFSLNITKANITPHQLQASHIKTHAFQSGVLFDGGELTKRAIKSIDDMAHPVNLALRTLKDGEKVAIASSKTVRDLMEKGFKGEGDLAKSELIKVLRRFNVLFGHTGKDHRGSNEFESCSALLLLGEPRWNIGATRRQADRILNGVATDEDRKRLYREEVESIVFQWVGRLRTVWNPNRIFVYASPLLPEEELPNTSWSQYEKLGRGVSPEQQVLELKAHRLLDDGELLSIPLVKSWGLSDTSARRLVKRIGEQRPLIEQEALSSGGRPAIEWYDPRAVKARESRLKKLGQRLFTESAKSLLKRLKEGVFDLLQPLKEKEPIYNNIYNALSVKSLNSGLYAYNDWENLVLSYSSDNSPSASHLGGYYD